ncbi:MAG TPA: tRNA (adenosine(37)-N6)-dimethylallyltransferase MiaA [Flavisolibacter sp.]|nr:tRNA (adenosine(37)-N6)-dimethylallyltransferase MiaA [Flavisolibacter sp.]
MSGNKTVIIIAGPTAVGKTALGIEAATYFQTEIISADSRQCYKELSIGVARPTPEELAAVTHHFIGSHSIREKVTAATFEQYALEKAATLFEQHDVVVMVGGTGLYIKAFCEGLDEVPEVAEEIRKQIIGQYQEQGMEWLQSQVQEKDPKFYMVGETQNPHRLMRALEVVMATGESILNFRTGIKKERPFNVIKIALDLPREQLHHNINTRVDKMITQGLVDEVRTVVPYKTNTALQTVGYKEIFSYLDGEINLEEATELIKRNTRQYAKRQLTWFRKDKEYQWIAPATDQLANLLKDIKKAL